MRLAKWLGGNIILRRMFFLTLDMLFLRAWYVRRELQRLSVELKNKPCLLDAGMGFGQYSDRMLRTFPNSKLTGLEIDKAHMYGAERYFRILYPSSELVIGDVRKLTLRSDKYDIVLTVDVMEHVDDDVAAFSEFYRVLKPGGFLVMHTPRIVDDDPGSHEKGSHHHKESSDTEEKRWHVDEHVRDGYSDREASEKLEDQGFEIVRITSGYGFWGRIAWTLLQRIPMSLLGASWLLAPVVAAYLAVILPLALTVMSIDVSTANHERGGSLLVTARKPKRVK